jgi:hypothetical protein
MYFHGTELPAPITSLHISEAINYRMLDPNLWK